MSRHILVFYGSYRRDRHGINLANWLVDAIKARGDSAELRLREAELLLASGLRTEAEMAFQALEAEPALAARAKTGRAVALIRGGRSAEAEELLLTAVRLDAGLARAWSTLALALVASRRTSLRSVTMSKPQPMARAA